MSLAILREENLDILSFISNRATRFAAAYCVGILEHWTEWKRSTNRVSKDGIWVYMPIIRQPRTTEDPDGKKPTSWHREMLGQYGKDAIRSALNLLMGLGVVKRRTNTYNGQDRTYSYQLNYERWGDIKNHPPSTDEPAETLEPEAVAALTLEPDPFSESEISPLGGDCPPARQISIPSTDTIERTGAKPAENEGLDRAETLISAPKSSPQSQLHTESLAQEPEPQIRAEGAAALGSQILFFKSIVDWSTFQTPAPDETGPLAALFDWVLKERVPKLPKPPICPESAAEGWLRKSPVALWRGFINWQERELRRKSLVLTATPMPTSEECARSPAARLAVWQKQWQNPHLRRGIRQTIRDNPDLGIVLAADGSGPCLRS